ncbi:centromere protein T [Ranitomeya variabilis]|uniref:centromere protein T n=1 Tax=Ranitomeya variabilis TaxID=490064 RepID=UPI004056EB27
MEGSSTDRRSLHRGILVTEPVRRAMKNPSKRENRQPSTSFAQQDEIPSSPSLNLRSKMKERVRHSLSRSGGESPLLKRKVDTNFRTKVISARKRALPLIDDLDDITPRTLLKKIIQNEDEVSLVVSQRSKAAANDDRKPENSLTAQLSGVGDVNLSLPELEDTEYVTVLRKTGKKRKLRVSEFEREVDKRLTMNNDNDSVSLDSFASSSSRANSYTLSRPFETKLDNSAIPETTFKKVLLRRQNKVCLVSVDDFEQGVDDKYQRLKGSQECFIPPAMEDRSETSSDNLALMNTQLYAQSLRKDTNTPTSENGKQRRASKLFLSSQDERKEASGELSERGTRKLKANDRSTEENVIKQFRGDHSKAIEDSDGGEDSEDNVVHVSDQAVYNSSKDGADDGHGSGEVTDDDSEDDADDGHGSDEVENDNGEEDDADDGHGSGEVTDDDSEDDADDGHATGKDGADVVHGLGEITDDNSEDEAADGHAAGEDGAGVVHGSGEAEDDSDEDDSDEDDSDEDDSDEDDSDEDDSDEADDVHVEAKVADDLPDDESNMQPNKSSVTHSNRKTAGIADYSHPERRARLSSRLSYGNNMKTADSIHLQSVSVSRSEAGSELLETTGYKSLHLAMARGIKKVESNQLVLDELPEPPPYINSLRFARTDKPAPVRKKIQRTKSTKPKKSGSVLKSSQVKQIFNRHAQVRVSKEAFTDVEKCLDLYMDQLASDLGAYTAHAKRKTITRADMELLMKRQRLVTDTTSLNVLIEKHLPLECRTLLIPCAKGGNQVFPKFGASSFK